MILMKERQSHMWQGTLVARAPRAACPQSARSSPSSPNTPRSACVPPCCTCAHNRKHLVRINSIRSRNKFSHPQQEQWEEDVTRRCANMQGPDKHTGVVQERDATPLRACLQMQVFTESTHRPALECSRREEHVGGRNTGAGMQRTHGQLPAPHVQHIVTRMHGRGSLARVTGQCAQQLGGGIPG